MFLPCWWHSSKCWDANVHQFLHVLQCHLSRKVLLILHPFTIIFSSMVFQPFVPIVHASLLPPMFLHQIPACAFLVPCSPAPTSRTSANFANFANSVHPWGHSPTGHSRSLSGNTRQELREGGDSEVIPLRKKTYCLLQYFGDPFFSKPSASSWLFLWKINQTNNYKVQSCDIL